MKNKSVSIIFGILFLLLGQGYQSPFPIWSAPELIYPFQYSETRKDVFSKSVSDPAGRIHLFWVEDYSDKPSELYYAVWDQVWKKAVNIFLGDELTYFDAVVTSDWRIHLVWMDDGIYYASAPIAGAGNVSAWSKPILLDGRKPGFINLILGENQEIVAVYPVLDEPVSGQMVISLDGGVTWSTPVVIAEPPPGKIYTRSTAVAGAGNRIHAVFASASLPNGYPPEEIWYVHSAADLYSWSAPQKLTDGTFSDPAIARYSQQGLLLTLSGTLEQRGFFSMTSRNNGETWTGLSENFAPGSAGLSRPMRLAVDSIGTVHGVIDSDSPEAMLYVQWNANIGWSEILNLSQTYYPELEEKISNPSIAIVLGNEISAIFIDERKGVFEVKNTISADHIPPLATPTYLAITEDPHPETQAEQAVSTLPPILPNVMSSPEEEIQLSSGTTILVASLSVVLFLLVVILIQLKRRN